MTTTDNWLAPQPSHALNAVVEVPGSKSQTNRALILAALADGPSAIHQPLHARDTMLMAQALRALGVGGRDIDADPAHGGGTVRGWVVEPQPMHGPAAIDCGLAGTVMRFVPALAALAVGPITFDGDPRARQRPMSTVIDALRELGVTIDDEGRGCLPFTVHGEGAITGGTVVLDASASSQFVSALLLIGARCQQGLSITHRGGPLPSMPHIAMTLAMLRERGVSVTETIDGPTSAQWTVAPGVIRALDTVIEPDLSNAAPFLAAAAVAGGSVTIPRWPAQSTQAGDQFPELLQQMGAQVHRGTDSLTLTGTGSLHGLDVDMSQIGELVPTFAAVAALADSASVIRGVAHLRGHETDRLAALVHDLRALGGSAHETDDGLIIEPTPLHGGIWKSFDDHRMATAGAIIGLRVNGVQIDDIDATAKTLPGFTASWSAMLEQQS